jgi:cyanophycin synthetase
MILLVILIIIFILFVAVNTFLEKKINENYTGLTTDRFFDEIRKKKYEIDYYNKLIIYNDKKISYDKHFNTSEARDTAKNKIETSTILKKANIPVPKFIKIDLSNSIDDIKETINKNHISYPVVMKPINGTFGIDVVTDIETTDELSDSINSLKKRYKEILLEEQVEGDCYRIFVFNDKVIDIIKREKPYIYGNGKNTIKELIKIRNKEQLQLELIETNNVSELFIKKQGYKMDDIPDKKNKIYISNVINMHNGARIFRIPINRVPKKNIDLFIKVNKAMKIYCSGLDYMSNDITVPYDKNNSYILEVNGTPDTEIHTKIIGFNFFEKVVDAITM